MSGGQGGMGRAPQGMGMQSGMASTGGGFGAGGSNAYGGTQPMAANYANPSTPSFGGNMNTGLSDAFQMANRNTGSDNPAGYVPSAQGPQGRAAQHAAMYPGVTPPRFAQGTPQSAINAQQQKNVAAQMQGFQAQGAAGNWDPYANYALGNLDASQWDPNSYSAIEAQLNDRINGGQKFMTAVHGTGPYSNPNDATYNSVTDSQALLSQLRALRGY